MIGAGHFDQRVLHKDIGVPGIEFTELVDKIMLIDFGVQLVLEDSELASFEVAPLSNCIFLEDLLGIEIERLVRDASRADRD